MRVEPLIGIAAGVLLACASISLLILVLRKNRAVLRAGRHADAGPGEPGADAARLDQPGWRIDGELPDRLEQMIALLAEADAKIEELRRLVRVADEQCALGGRPDDVTCVEIDRLARQGLDAVEIARRTGLTVGKIELVLHLQRCRKTPIEIEKSSR